MLTLLEIMCVQLADVRSGFRLPEQRDTLVHMGTAQPSVARSRHQARPGRRALVARHLDALRGPDTGQVELPVRLFWSSPDRCFDLGDDDQRAWLYETVLRHAGLCPQRRLIPVPVNEFHRQVAAIVLRVAAEYGFAVGGGTALIAHGIVDRYTADLDLVSPRERAAARHRRAFRPACIKAPRYPSGGS